MPLRVIKFPGFSVIAFCNYGSKFARITRIIDVVSLKFPPGLAIFNPKDEEFARTKIKYILH